MPLSAPEIVRPAIWTVQVPTLLLAKVPVKVHINTREAGFVHRISDLSDSDVVAVEGGDVVHVGNVPITFIHTPGHTPGSQCFLAAGNLISGDTLFIGSCGRSDLPGSRTDAENRRSAGSQEHAARRL